MERKRQSLPLLWDRKTAMLCSGWSGPSQTIAVARWQPSSLRNTVLMGCSGLSAFWLCGRHSQLSRDETQELIMPCGRPSNVIGPSVRHRTPEVVGIKRVLLEARNPVPDVVTLRLDGWTAEIDALDTDIQ